MTNLIFVTQVMDEGDPVLGFVSGLVRALADRCEAVAVVANEVRAVPADLGADVVSLGKERGAGRMQRGLRYESALVRLARTMAPDALLAHMCPVYANLAAPVTRRFRIPLLLWFAHWARYRPLRLAERLSDVVLTSLPGAYPGTPPNLRIIGQATDTDRFALSPPPPRDDRLRLVALGRTSPSKGLPVPIRATALARARGLNVTLTILGPSSTREEGRHRTELGRLIRDLGVEDAVSIRDGVPAREIPTVIREADGLVSAMAPGMGDKVVFEAMSIGRPVLVSNPAFDGLVAGTGLELRFREGDAEDLAGRIGELHAAGTGTRGDAGRELRRRVVDGHSIGHWADQVVAIAAELRSERSSRSGR